MNCDDFRSVSLTPPLSVEARAHVDSCAECRAFVDRVAVNERLLRAVPRPSLPAGLWERLERRLPPVGRPAPLASWAGLAAAAALLVAAVGVALRHQDAPTKRLSLVIVEAPAATEEADREDLAEYASLGGGQGVQFIDAGGGD